MESSTKIAGVTIGGMHYVKRYLPNQPNILADLSRQMIYSQMMVPLKVSTLSKKIAETYLRVSREFIMPAQRLVAFDLLRPRILPTYTLAK